MNIIYQNVSEGILLFSKINSQNKNAGTTFRGNVVSLQYDDHI